jgi:arylsulfatase A-like enzyme
MDSYAEGLPTLPARRAIKTGRPVFPFRYIPQLGDGVQLMGWHPLYDEDVTLSEHLRSKGYYTCFVTDVYHMMKPGKNFHRGYHTWYWIRGQEDDPYAIHDLEGVRDLYNGASYAARKLDKRSWIVRHLNLRKEWKTDADTSVAKTMKRSAEWIREYSLDDPFFLYVDCFDPHEPWDPPPELARLYDKKFDSLNGCIPPGTTEEMTEEQLGNVKTAYAGEVTLVDKWIGHLLEALEQKGYMKDTLLIFTSDHGCMLGERGEIHKGESRIRNQCTRVPLMIRHPGKLQNRKIQGFVQHQDIMPTCLGLMGLGVPQRCLGRNIWPDDSDENQSPEFVVTGFGKYACIRTRKWNYIQPWVKIDSRRPPRYELYDLENDPEELNDVLAEHPGVGRELREKLQDYIKTTEPFTAGSFQTPAADGLDMSFDALPSLNT